MITIEKKSLAGYSFIDLFAGLGGFRIALESLGAKCVYSNEWNVPVQKVYADNFGDIPVFPSAAVVAKFATTDSRCNSPSENTFFICLEIVDLSLWNNSAI